MSEEKNKADMVRVREALERYGHKEDGFIPLEKGNQDPSVVIKTGGRERNESDEWYRDERKLNMRSVGDRMPSVGFYRKMRNAIAMKEN
ncbi:MAG: hypothetical protein ACI9GH_000107 [Candidatus Paceibacteria bacterium]|jgi:hypothetical protein